MVYTWFSGYRSDRVTGKSSEEVPLTSISSNETLRRVILHWRVQLAVASTDLLADWLEAGVVSLVEFTVGAPPPIPTPVTLGEFDTRDILYSQLEFPGPTGVFVNSHAVPGDNRSGIVDVEVSRKPAPDAGIVWWAWGCGPPGGAEIGYLRAWWRVLIES